MTDIISRGVALALLLGAAQNSYRDSGSVSCYRTLLRGSRARRTGLEPGQRGCDGEGRLPRHFDERQESVFVWDLLTSHNFAAGLATPNNRWFWLGGYQQHPTTEPGGGWAWVTGEPWVYTNWSPLVLTSGTCTAYDPNGVSAPWNNCQNPARGEADFLHFAQNKPTDLSYSWATINCKSNRDQQSPCDRICRRCDDDPTPSPDPATLALAAAGLLIIIRHRRRFHPTP